MKIEILSAPKLAILREYRDNVLFLHWSKAATLASPV